MKHDMKKFNLTQFECRIQDLMNPLTPMSDGDRISPYIIDTVSSRKVMRPSWSNTKFSELTL